MHPMAEPPPEEGALEPAEPPPPTVAERVDALDDRLRAVAGRVEEVAADVGSVLEANEALRQAVAELRSLVEIVLDTMPGSEEGSGADQAERVADAVAARLDADVLARDVAERLRQHFEVVAEDGG